jgi:signal transduction histidine kinase
VVTAPVARNRLTVDLRGLKAALTQQARARGIPPSQFVRNVLAAALGQASDAGATADDTTRAEPGDRLRLSLRLRRDEAHRLRAAAASAGLPLGACVSGLAAGVAVLQAGARRDDYLAAATASCAELATLGRSLRHLSDLLRQGSVRAAQEYRDLLDTVAGDVQRNLEVASAALVDLQPSRAGAAGIPPRHTARR